MSERQIFLNGSPIGTETVTFTRKADGYHTTLIRVHKNADFDYLYIQQRYRDAGILRGEDFAYAGIYCKRDGLIYDGQYAVRDLFDGDGDAMQARGAGALRKNLQAAVINAVEDAIGNDRANLRITALSSEKALKKLAYFQKYTAAEFARREYLTGDGLDVDEDDEDVDEKENDEKKNGEPRFAYCCDYEPPCWTDDSLLAYILDPDGYVRAEAKTYIDSCQEEMLTVFLENDAVAKAYKAIIENPSNPIHRVKRIMRAVSASSAKTVTVTVRKDGVDFTFKAEAGQFRCDCESYYNNWFSAAADRAEFERLFGRGARFGPEDILRITYARSVLFENAAAAEV